MFNIEIPFVDTPRPTMGELTAITAGLYAIAGHIGLPWPRYATVSDSGRIGLQFPPERDSLNAVLLWASTYSAVMRSDTHQGASGPEIWASTTFELDGAEIKVYAHIPVSEVESNTCAEF